MKSFLSGKKRSIVVDITPDFVHIIELSGGMPGKGNRRKSATNDANIQIIAAGSEWFPAGCISAPGVILDPEPIQEALKKLLDRLHIKPKTAGILIPSSQAITKVISLPSDMNSRQIEEQIIADSSRYIPYPIEDVDFDFFVMGDDADISEHQKIMVAACKKETVESYVAILEHNHIKPSVIDVRSLSIKLAMENFSGKSKNSEFMVAIEFGLYVTSMQVYNGDNLVYARNHNFGLNILIRDIESTKNMDRNDIFYLIKSGKLEDDEIGSMVKSYIDTTINNEVINMMNFFKSTVNDSGDESIIIFGVGANLPGFKDSMEKTLKTTVILCNPLTDKIIPGISERNMGIFDQSALFPAYGLAMRDYL
jgi:type IV pilus assembly protein PilM